MKALFLSLFVLTAVLISGCIGSSQPVDQVNQIISDCIKACQNAKSSGTDLSPGPCLSNNISEGWVCDVAHSPRQAIDNDPANQCSAFGVSADHFVEVDPDCKFVRKY